MFKALFNIIINLVATVVQLITFPLNAIIVQALPDFSNKITEVTETLSSVFSSMFWAIGLLPTPIIITLLFILSVEIAKHTIYISTHTLIKVWAIIQKIKFW